MSTDVDATRIAAEVSAATPDPAALSAAMAQLAREFHRQHGSVDDTLAAITKAAAVSVPGAEDAAISLSTRRSPLENHTATHELPRRVVHLQAEVGEGPCLQSLADQVPVRVDDLAAEQRWPQFRSRMAGELLGSMLSVPLSVDDGGSLGSLSLYATVPAAFDAQSEEIGLVFASHAAVALAAARNEEGLRLALTNRDLIGQAKGILMERHKLTGQQAFLLLVRASQSTNVKLRDLAEELVDTGALTQ
jgi:GAF domain-containing protein